MDYMRIPYPTRVVLVRHAESEGNVLSREGQIEFAKGTNFYNLTARGREQARITSVVMREMFSHPDFILRSYFMRTNETAQIVYPGREIKVDALLAERDRGIWTNATTEQVKEFMPWEIDRKQQQGPYHYRPPGGENLPDVERRVREFRRSLKFNCSGKTVVVFGHGHWILLWKKIVHRWEIDETIANTETQAPENASILVYHNTWSDERQKYIMTHDPETDYLVPWKGKL